MKSESENRVPTGKDGERRDIDVTGPAELTQAGLMRVRIEHTPSPTDPKGADEFYRTLGIFVVAWGRLEGQFVASLLNILNISGGEKLGAKLPMKQGDRIDLWRKAFTQIVLLVPMKQNALLLLDEMHDLAKDRDTLVHALWEPFAQTEPPSVDIVTIKHKNKTQNGLETNRHKVTIEKLREIVHTANRLNMAMAPVSHFLARLRFAQNPPPENVRII